MSLFVEIKKQFKGFKLDVSFETNNEYLGILGASGSGKSMTLKCIAGIETPDEGKIILNNRILFDSEKKINLKPQERNIGFLFQNYALFPNMTVEKNIGAGLKFSKNENKKIIKEMIDIFRLSGLEKKYPINLSGGQQQRVALARAIAYKPDVILFDEPFSALDTHLKEKLQIEVLDFLKYYEGEVLMVTHSRDEAYKFCKNILIVDGGKDIIFGCTKNIFNDPKYLQAAKITGCKNISECEVFDQNSVYAKDWNIVLQTEKSVPKDTKYIGIHSHNLQILHDKSYEENNIMSLNILKASEEIFEYSLLLENKNLEEQSKNENSAILLKIKKEAYESIKNKDNFYLKIPENSILLLK